jgi:hypothetical protein
VGEGRSVDPIQLLPALALGMNQPGRPQLHQVLGDAGGDQVRELRGQISDIS